MEMYNPSNQLALISNSRGAFTANAPTIATVRTKMSPKVIVSWLEIQLLDLATYVGVKEKINDMQMATLSELITGQFYYYKLTELMLFFARLKSGRYGRFYGVVDPQVIGEALHAFDKERAEELAKIAKKEQADKVRARDTEREKQLKNGELMSYGEYKEIGWLFNM